jgi:hypothetical protein
VDARVWDQVGLEFSQIHVEGTVETERSRNRRDDLADKTVQVGVAWAFNVEITTADVIDGFVVDHESAVGMLQSSMGGQDGIVGLDNSSRDLGSRVDGELELGFLAIIDRETLHQQGSEAGSSATTERVEDEEALETSTLVRQLANAIQHQVNNLFANGVVAASVVVGGIFLAGDELLGVEERAVSTGTDFIDHSGFKIDKDGAGDVLSRAAFGEESVERVINASDGLVTWHLAIRLDTVLQTVQLPASITDLNSGLANVD